MLGGFMSEFVTLVGPGGDELIVDVSSGAPTILHWGASLGADAEVAAVLAALDRPGVAGAGVDTVAPLSVVPEHGAGFPGRPGLVGRRGGGRSWAPRFTTVGHRVEGGTLVVEAVDETAGLALTTTISSGDVLRVSAELTNTAGRRYSLDSLTITVPIPDHFDELLTFDGRWTREFHEQRRPWLHGSHLIENRTGRTSHEHVPLVFAGTHGFGEWQGEVLGAHVAWSGNHQLFVECLADGRRYVQGGELLHPGEVVLEPGESYTTPDLVLTRSDRGLTPATWGYHRAVRALPGHPVSPRPVLVNTWEAVYFDHDAGRLRELATAAAELGVERFVLDDGWFGSRRDDTSGLGDWWVPPDVYPDGLAPLIEHVTSLGMEFGIWVEPEMVNADSDVYREHPDWALTTSGYDAITGRNQLVLDLANPDAYSHVHGLLDALLGDHDIRYVKWDMNRAHAQGSGADDAAGARAQTLAVYRLIDELRAAHLHVEIESCASGGGRVDHEILRRTQRVWTSDCNDALERQRIQRGASMLIPPEVMGAHIGPSRSHTTGRTHTLAFRAATALFGHLGIEWDITSLDDRERGALRTVIERYRCHRDVLHSGDVVRFDTGEHSLAHGVYAADRSEAIVSYAQLTTAPSLTPSPLRLPDLDAAARYRVEVLELAPTGWGPAVSQPAWLADGVELTGAQLASHGVRPPVLHPESAVLFHLVRR